MIQTTRYFREQVLRKRPYLKIEWIQWVLSNPVRKDVQPDGRIRYWGFVEGLGARALRVVTLADGQTVHNAFLDRGFEQQEQTDED